MAGGEKNVSVYLGLFRQEKLTFQALIATTASSGGNLQQSKARQGDKPGISHGSKE